jgi:uncharacterized protein YjbJ (UPF0337 family)
MAGVRDIRQTPNDESSTRFAPSNSRPATMKDSSKDKARGALHEAKGKIIEKAGQIADDPELEAKGAAERIAGKVQNTVGKIEKALGELSARVHMRENPPRSAPYVV